MEIVTGIVGKVAEYAIEPAIHRVDYLTHCRSSLQNLQTQVNELTSAREGVEHKVDEAERQGKRIEGEVQNWLKQVDEITGKAGELWKDETQARMLCLHGFCPNLILRYQLSRKSKKLEQVAVKLYEKRGFTNFSYDVPPQEVCIVSTKYYEAFDSRMSTLKNIMDELRSPSTDLILVYGIGGVGKTTLAEEVLRQATEKKLFTDAVMVHDVNNPDLQGIQKEIAKKLGMEVDENGIMAERKLRLCSRIKDKKVLVILDNIWEKIDLEAVGLPCLPNCKILLTSRNRKFLSSEMRPQKEFRLEVLNEKETWSLFEKKAGDVVKDHAIRNIAIQVSEKCGGLPVLVVAVASALRNRSTLYAWNDALRCLKAFDGEELTEQAYSALDWSYNQLDNKLKPLFLLCAIYIGASSHNSTQLSGANLSDLFKCAMGLGFFKNCSMEQASNALHSWIEKLKDSCLLLANVGDKYIRMHDLVHNVAIAIVSKDQRTLFKTSGGDLKEWPNNRDFFEKCTIISLTYCNIPRLPEVFECQELEMFILGFNGGDPVEIPDTFFKGMIKLKVLDLTKLDIGSLPSSLQLLENLRTLCLDGCVLGDIALVGQLTGLEILSFLYSNLKELPKEIGKLTRLRLLDLRGCQLLEVISPYVLSSLKSLEDLRMQDSFDRWVAEGVTGERSNASLSELKDLPHLAALAVRIPDASIIPRGLFSDKLKRYDISIGDPANTSFLIANVQFTDRYGIWESMDGTLNRLKLKLTTRQELDDGLKKLLKRSEALFLHGLENDFQSDSEDFQQLKHLYVQNIAKFTYIINEKVGLPNLTTLVVHECGSRFLLSSSMARSQVQLKYLEVNKCYVMEEIVSTEENGEENANGVFCKLQYLKLENLQILSRFCSGFYVEFPSLESLEIVNCNVLETFVCEPRSKSITVRRETKEDLKKTVVQYFLFDDKVGLPRLKSLFIRGLNKLTAIWHNQHVPGSLCRGDNTKEKHEASAQNLVKLVICECSNLQYILYCPGIEEIIAKVEGVETTPEFVFPKVISFRLEELPQFKSFYPGIHASKWPLLEKLIVRGCDQLDIFSVELPSFQKHVLGGVSAPIKQPLFLIEKDSFPKLDKLDLDGTMEICGDLLPAEVFRKLKSVEFRAPYSIVETSHEQGRRARKIQGSGGLRHLWKENSPPACPVFPSLEILTVLGCIRLQDLVTSAISFQNLTTLQVVGCHRLKSLTNYSVAKTLMQLREMTLVNCKRMIKIVETSDGEDAAGNEIAFSRLLHLKLSSLPSLKDFCSGNCIVKFPQLKTFSVSNCPELKISSELERTPLQEQFDRYFYSVYDRIVDGDDDDDDDDDVEMVPENSI